MSIVQRAALAMLRDSRDLPFVYLIVAVSAIVVPFAAFLIANPSFPWWIGGAYVCVVVGVLYLPVLVMYHDIAHRPPFKPRYRFLRHYLNWVLAPLFGLFPNGYFAHHVAMHHAENNLGGDLSSTMRYQRDSLLDFLRYSGVFVVSVFGRLAFHLWRRRKYRLARAVLIGEASFLLAIGTLAWFNWRGALVVFVIPLVAAMAGFCAINWTQHAFIDRDRPYSVYRNAIVCLHPTYNRLAFNDGYHICHHLKPHMHWAELPAEFERHQTAYLGEGAVVFHGLHYLSVFVLLLTKQYRVLARHCLQLPSDEQTILLLRQRTARFSV